MSDSTSTTTTTAASNGQGDTAAATTTDQQQPQQQQTGAPAPWIEVTAADPCVICEEPAGCKARSDGSEAGCLHGTTENRPRVTSQKDGRVYTIYNRDDIAARRKARERRRLSPKPAKLSEVLLWMRLLLEPGQVTELRAVGVSHTGYRIPHIEAGFFDYDHLEDMAKEALRLTMRAQGVYFTLNPLDPEIVHKRFNRVDVSREGDGAQDEDVTRRRWLLIDTDAERRYKVSATDEEKAATLTTIQGIREHLRDEGWPEGIFADSGNGYHLLYRIDLPRDDGGFVKRILCALNHRFGTDAVEVDPVVFNPARICKFPGTIARKGDSTPKRPHRAARILEVPTP